MRETWVRFPQRPFFCAPFALIRYPLGHKSGETRSIEAGAFEDERRRTAVWSWSILERHLYKEGFV
jgi:hypothetical protein